MSMINLFYITILYLNGIQKREIFSINLCLED